MILVMPEAPEQSIAELRDCLTQVARPLALLVGAGCPIGTRGAGGRPLIPGVEGLTKSVEEALRGSPSEAPLSTICTHLKNSGVLTPNVELILNRIRGLREVVDGHPVDGLTRETLDEVERAVCNQIAAQVKQVLPDDATGYHSLAAWIGAVPRSAPVEVFTTNYDSLLEQALEKHRVPYFDGFVGAHRPFFDLASVESDKLPARWARLWKLHGSIEWKSQRQPDGLHVWRGSEGESTVIFPSHLKYDQSRRMPYLALMDRLRHFISTRDSVLVTIGYSFRDDHINETIVQGLQANQSAIVFGLVYGKLAEYDAVVELAKTRTNLRIQAADGALIGTRKSIWAEVPREPSAVSADAIRWNRVSEEPASWLPEFLLGSFENFGQFLQGLGRAPRASG